jgi:two-component system, chemotaxis family, sensor kinase CheA
MSTPGAGAGDDFIAGFLDDYFAEAEEHLAVVRRGLLALEDSIGDPASGSTVLEELFRSFHSLKGLSAMVDVRPAERLAHELESYLRALREGELVLTLDALSVLIDSTATLESVIEARRSAAPAPVIEDVVQRLVSLTGPSRGSRARRPAAIGPEGESTAAPPAWRFMFVPSPALVDRGVKVDTIRARLAAVGRITSVSPKVTAGGGIAFEFLVTGEIDPAVLDSWRNDGLTWERVDAAAIPAAAAPAAEHARPASAVPETSILAPSHLVRVDLKRLDEVMRRVADLVITRARFEETLARVERFIPSQEWRALQENTLTFERQLRDLREDVMRVRLVRVDEIFRRMPFVVRDLAREAGKDVRVVLSGQDTEIDKFLVERMMDPVIHLVRNAVSHGIESPERRLAAGKPAQGVISLGASTSGEMVVIEIADDGAGIDAASVAERARAAGARIGDGPLDSRTLVDLICEPGFSTRHEADRASGRGIGMAVVRTTVQELGGTLNMESEPGHGTRFVIALPLTLAITDALIAVVAGQRFAVPQNSVREVIEIDEATVRQLENNELVPYRGRSLPLLRLDELFDLPGGRAARMHAFVIGMGQEAVALGVERILGQREIVVRTMSDALLKIDGISGATELGDGKVVLILDAPALSRRGRAGARQRRRADAPTSSAPGPGRLIEGGLA